MSEDSSQVITARLSLTEVRKLDEMAKLRRRTRSQMVREAVAHYLEEASDYEIALERFHDPADKPITGDELWANLGWS